MSCQLRLLCPVHTVHDAGAAGKVALCWKMDGECDGLCLMGLQETICMSAQLYGV